MADPTSAALVADACKHLTLVEAAPNVRAALRADPRTDKMQISITADQGIVTLAGIVNRVMDPLHASEVVTAVLRVTEIRNQLKTASA